MRRPVIKPILASIAFILTVLLNNSASAGVIILFEEVDGDVIATTSGSILVPSTPRDSWSASGGGFYGDTYGLYFFGDPVDAWRSGSFEESGLSSTPTSAEGDTFGYYAEELEVPSGLEPGSFYFPHTTWTWENETLGSIGLGYLTTTPFQVYDRDSQTISFAIVPEPTVISMLMGAGVLAFACLRRRKK